MKWREDAFRYLCEYDREKQMRVILDNMPTFLYRYRGCSDNDIDTIKCQNMWLSSVDGLNDKDEFTLNFDRENLNMCEIEAVPKVVDLIKSTTMVSCFTENINDEYFWKEYANEYKGFCIAYRTKDIIEYLSHIKNIYFGPVKYGAKMLIRDYTKEACKFAFTIFEKDMQWCKENEWRILYNHVKSDDQDTWGEQAGELIDFIKPSKIYLGKSMTKESSKSIIEICFENGIEIGIQH